MNKTFRTFLLFLLITSYSCSPKENLKLLSEIKTDEYHIKIYRLDSKKDKNGKGQCEKYSRTAIDSTGYYSYGKKLIDELASTYIFCSKKYLSKLPEDSLNDFYLRIDLDNLSKKSLNYREIINKALKQTFNLTITPKEVLVNGFSFSIINENKLNSFLSKDTLDKKIQFEDNKFYISTTNLLFLSNTYDLRVSDYINYSGINNSYFTFEFTFYKDIDKANLQFEDFGLRLKEDTFYKTIYEIKSNVGI